MSMNAFKAALNTTTGAVTIRQDLSSLITLEDEYLRPVLDNAPQVPATSTLHEWDEQGLNAAGFTNAAGGGATSAEGVRPNPNFKTTVKKNNSVCRSSRLAQVTDTLKATWTQGGRFTLGAGEEERMMNEAIDFASYVALQEVLNQIEFMHIAGDTTNSESLEGGQCDGLVKWVTANGTVVATGGTTTTAVNMSEAFIKDGARGVALNQTAQRSDTLLVAPEVIPDINSYVANGAARPIVTIANGDNSGLTAGNDVGWYNTGYGKLKIQEEPYLSPTLNSKLSNPALIGYRKSLVKHASLIPVSAEPLARIGPSTERQIICEYTQEHRMGKHAFIIPNVKSAIA